MLKTIAIAASIAIIAATGATAASAARDGADKVEFYKVTQDQPTNGIERFIIKGDKCLATEDATKLRLVEYAPSQDKVVYRCVQP